MRFIIAAIAASIIFVGSLVTAQETDHEDEHAHDEEQHEHHDEDHADHDDDHDDHDHDEHADHEEHDDHAEHDDDHEAHEDEFADHKATAGDVTILHAWTNATTESSARVYMEIENEGHDPVTLMGGDAQGFAESVILMGAPVKPGAPPEVVGDVPIAEEAHMELQPNGLFLLLEGIPGPLTKGDSFEMHVEIAPLGEIAITVEVEAADATQHSHAGHAH